MATDFLSDREQEEALLSWLKENWAWMASGVAVGFLVLAGWYYWQRHVEQQGEAAAQAYQELTQVLGSNDKDKIDAAAKTLSTDYGDTPYADQAHLLLAQSHVNGGRFEMALTELKTVVDQSKDDALVQIAKLRLARVHIQLGHHDEALALLDVGKAGAFAASVHEIRGDALLAKGDSAGARSAYEAAIMAAQSADPRTAMSGNEYLQLKLQELGPAPATAAPAAALPSSAPSSAGNPTAPAPSTDKK
jgi:predicted negative regulator of RcsB-dependent stress response